MKKYKILITVLSVLLAPVIAYAVVQSLDGLSAQNQIFGDDTNITMTPTGTDTHQLGWTGQLAISRGGTNASSFTSGSVLFFGGGRINENNSNFFWDETNTRLGIGTTVPGHKIDIQGGQLNASGGLCIAGDCRTAWPSAGATASGSQNFLAKFTGTTSLGNSLVFDNGTNVGVGTTNPGSKLTVVGTVESTTGGFKFPDGTTQITAASTAGTTFGAAFRDLSTSGTQVIAHGLGTTPRVVRIKGYFGSTSGISTSSGVYNGTTTVGAYADFMGTNNGHAESGSSWILKFRTSNNATEQSAEATISIDGTNITLTWSKTNFPSGVAHFVWEAEK